MPVKALTYKKAGVDIDAADDLIEKIKPLAKQTHRPEVLSSIGHYAGLFALNKDQYKDPVLVASTDGVGTKLKLALEWDYLDGLGQDLVAMSANDVLCMGAAPLFFLDYFATGRLDVPQASRLLKGIARACQDIGCSLLGGETAEMPLLYRNHDFDLAGFLVGIVERDALIDGSRVEKGDQIIGLASSGLHSNGFSLVRHLLRRKKISLEKKFPGLNRPLGEALLEPTRLYVKNVLEIQKLFPLHAIAHITGGGLLENLPRVFPEDCRAVLHRDSWPRMPLFQWLQKWGSIEDEEMFRVFNSGIGLTVIVPRTVTHSVMKKLQELGEECWVIGEIVAKNRATSAVEIV